MVRYLHYWEFLRIPRNSRKTWNSVCKGVNNTAKAKPQLGLFSVSQILHTGYESYPAVKTNNTNWTANRNVFGRTSSMQPMSLENRLRILPIGFESKNNTGAFRRAVTMSS